MEGEAALNNGVLEGWISLETQAARGKGYVRLKDGLCWTLLTAMRELKGFEEPSGRRRPMGASHGHAHADKRNWLERRRDEEASLGITTQPYCLIVGGGQGGLGLAARLKRTCPSPIIGRFSPQKTRLATGWKCTAKSWSSITGRVRNA